MFCGCVIFGARSAESSCSHEDDCVSRIENETGIQTMPASTDCIEYYICSNPSFVFKSSKPDRLFGICISCPGANYTETLMVRA